MATQFFYCTPCHKKHPTHQTLFEVLYNFSKTAPETCATCGAARELRLTLDFQLGAGEGDFKVVSSFLPEKLDSWLGEEEEEVTFYPFLVVLQRAGDGKQYCWMPYWHVVGKDAVYGQHAVCMDHEQFESLAAQVEDALLEPV